MKTNIKNVSRFSRLTVCLAALVMQSHLQSATEPGRSDAFAPPAGFDGPPPFGPGGFGGGPPGPGGPRMRQDIQLVDQFDKNQDGWLNTEERAAARAHLEKQRSSFGGPGRRFGPGGPGGKPFGPRDSGGEDSTPKPGPRVSVDEVKHYAGQPLYAPNVLRTVFLEFESREWEKELEDFHGTDVDVPAKLTLDGKAYHDVGIRFRGSTSYMMVGTGYKRSFNVSVDMAHKKQDVLGHRTLNLLNSNEDPTFLRTVLALQMARDYFPAPRANFVRVVINGEYWGIYVNAEQVNKDFVQDWFKTGKGARWKVPGSPGGRGGLAYLGDDVGAYKQIYEIKSKDDPKSWASLIKLCRVLNETPLDELETAIAPLLDVDGVLRYLAWDNVVANRDGFWTRASDYYLYQDEQGRFHMVPHDVNETFGSSGGPGGPGGPRGFGGPGRGGFGPGMFPAPREQFAEGLNQPEGLPPFTQGAGGFGGARGGRGGPDGQRRGGGPPGFGPGGPGGGGPNLDPLISADDTQKPLASKLLAVPALQAKYLAYIREMADTWLDWSKLGPIADSYKNLIADEVKADTRKHTTFEIFLAGIDGNSEQLNDQPQGQRVGGNIKSFVEQRRAFLLSHPEVKRTAQSE